MNIQFDIPAETIANMMISAIESGDPVTTASRGGWCNGINLLSGGEPHDCWYAEPSLYDGRHFVIEIIEVDDESTGHETTHKIGPSDIARGLAVMAKKFPGAFTEVITDNTDAPCADAFLQSMLFGEEKYA